MPTKQQLINKIKDLDFWLKHNPKHFDYVVKLREKQQAERDLINYDNG